VGRDFDILFGKIVIAGNEMGHQTVYLVYQRDRVVGENYCFFCKMIILNSQLSILN